MATDLEAAGAQGIEADLILDQDVTDETGWSQIISEIEARYSRLDILVNNAGIAIVDRL